MDLGLQGKTALITGASSGLGLACAKVLAEEGCTVVLVARNQKKLDDAVRSIPGAHGISCDLSDGAALAELPRKATEILGHIDILVLSTGHPPTYPFSEATPEQWDLGRRLLLDPATVLSAALIPGMRERGYGRLIFIGSIFGIEPEKSSVIQSTYRTGLNALSKCIATENAPYGITSNVICPGYFDTPLLRELAAQYAEQDGKTVEEVLEEWKLYSPMRKYGKAEDLGGMVAFLGSGRGEFVSGAVLVMDGGAVKGW